MHLAGWYLDFRVVMPPFFEQEIVQIRQGQRELVPSLIIDFMALPSFRAAKKDVFNLEATRC